MRRLAYMAVLLVLLVLLCWPRPIAPPTEAEPPMPAALSPDESDTEADDEAIPDSATDVSEFLRDSMPSTLPPPSDQGLLRDLEQAVEEIPGVDEIPRDPIQIRPDFAPLVPPAVDETESEPEPEPDP